MELTTCEQFKDHEHPHHEPCPQCGDTHRVSEWIPGRAMGGGWVRGASVKRCRTCDKMLEFVPDKY